MTFGRNAQNIQELDVREACCKIYIIKYYVFIFWISSEAQWSRCIKKTCSYYNIICMYIEIYDMQAI